MAQGGPGFGRVNGLPCMGTCSATREMNVVVELVTDNAPVDDGCSRGRGSWLVHHAASASHITPSTRAASSERHTLDTRVTRCSATQ